MAETMPGITMITGMAITTMDNITTMGMVTNMRGRTMNTITTEQGAGPAGGMDC